MLQCAMAHQCHPVADTDRGCRARANGTEQHTEQFPEQAWPAVSSGVLLRPLALPQTVTGRSHAICHAEQPGQGTLLSGHGLNGRVCALNPTHQQGLEAALVGGAQLALLLAQLLQLPQVLPVRQVQVPHLGDHDTRFRMAGSKRVGSHSW